MKVERSSSLETSSRHRHQEWVVCMEFTVRANEDGDEEEKVAAAGGEYRVSTSAKRASSNLTPKDIGRDCRISEIGQRRAVVTFSFLEDWTAQEICLQELFLAW
ncbi:unnamed protein product [Sphagnum jensenii]